MSNTIDYGNLSSYTLVPDNSSYLANTHYMPAKEPLSGATMSLMMVLSTLQYQAPSLSGNYATAAQQASQAAFIVSGGQAAQDKIGGIAEKNGLNLVHSTGINDVEMGVGYETYRIYRTHELKINGPKFYGIKTDLTLNTNSGTLGFKYGW